MSVLDQKVGPEIQPCKRWSLGVYTGVKEGSDHRWSEPFFRYRSINTAPMVVHPNVAYPPSIRVRRNGRAPKA